MIDYHQWNIVKKSLEKTKRAVISLGCSFAGGEGAYDQEVLEGLEWSQEGTGKPIQPKINDEEEAKLLQRYPELELDDDSKINFSSIEVARINFTRMFYKNSFVNVLAEKYFKGTYTGINFGSPGRGNRASIKNLQIWPYDWKKLENIIVVYCPSAMERFDMAKDDWNGYSAFTTLYPYPLEGKTPKANMWNGYSEGIYSEKNAVLEQILHLMELKQWCKVNNAKLIITPAFDKGYNKTYFEKTLLTKKVRNLEYQLVKEEPEDRPNIIEHLSHLIDQWNWSDMFYPDGANTFMDLCVKQEGITPEHYEYWQYLGKGSPKKWITHCCHPSAKAHDLFANLLHRKIKDMKYDIGPSH